MKTIFLFALLPIISCTAFSPSAEYRLSAKDKTWMPYQVNEVMVFESNLGDHDSIYIIDKDEYVTGPRGFSSGSSNEYQVIYGVNSRAELSGNGIWRGYQLLLIGSGEEGSYLHFQMHTNRAYMYSYAYPRIDSLEAAKPKQLRTAFDNYQDVYVFKESSHSYLADSLLDVFVNKFYWSKEHGLVKYNKLNGESFELKKKFVIKD